MDGVRVRRFRAGDENALAEIFFTAVRVVGRTDYTEDQLHAWATERPDPSTIAARAEDGRSTFVAVDANDRPIAYADLEASGHIDHMYCLPEWVGRGVGSDLYAAIEAEALAQSMQRLFVEASEAARRLFERRGFRVLGRNDLVRHGVELHNFNMEKQL